MNCDTGQIYRDPIEVELARKRGEPIVDVSEQVAKFMELGQRMSQTDAPKLIDLEKRLMAIEKKDLLESEMKRIGLVLPPETTTKAVLL